MGHSITETVEYQDPDYAIKVIRRAWSDYEVQDALIGWLGQLAKDATEQVRIWAGIALGRLATLVVRLPQLQRSGTMGERQGRGAA